MDDLTHDDVLFVAPNKAPAPGEAVLHAGPTERVVRSLADTSEDWKRIFGQVTTLVSMTDERVATSGWSLDEIKIGLTFDARGRLAFIAEAGMEATVEATFKRVVE